MAFFKYAVAFAFLATFVAAENAPADSNTENREKRYLGLGYGGLAPLGAPLAAPILGPRILPPIAAPLAAPIAAPLAAPILSSRLIAPAPILSAPIARIAPAPLAYGGWAGPLTAGPLIGAPGPIIGGPGPALLGARSILW